MTSLKNIRLLDCTLRDGGFVNNWAFGHSSILSIFKTLDTANIDIIEVGFLDQREPFDMGRSIVPNTACMDRIFQNISKSNALAVAMIDFGTCDIEHVSMCADSFLDGIRVIFKKKDIGPALRFCAQIKEKGYKLFVQPVSVTTYTDQEWVSLIEKINQVEPYAMSIVDTYGLLHKNNLLHYFELADKTLKEGVCIGYHSHNNFQLAYANSIELLDIKTQRTVVLDGSVYGMGKGAGNANLELLAMYLNEHAGTDYNINHILEIIDSHIIKLYQQFGWGYSLQFYLSALNDCHPKYVKYLTERKTLDIKSVNDILGLIEPRHKLSYNEKYIEELYIGYQNKTVNDDMTYTQMRERLSQRTVLLVGPGKSVGREKAKIDRFIGENTPVVISVNFIPLEIKTDYVFISNKKRYKELTGLPAEGGKTKLIVTSNVTGAEENADYTVNYDSLLGEDPVIMDNSMLMLLRALSKAGLRNVYLAGFDGFSGKKEEDYILEDMRYNVDSELIPLRNLAISKELRALKKMLGITFITKTLYMDGEETVC